MARILLVANSSWNINNFRMGLVRALVRDGHAVTTVTPDRAGVALDHCPLAHKQWKLDRSGTSGHRDLGSIVSLAKIFLQERPQVVLSFTIKPNIYAAALCRFLGIPAVPNISGLGTAFLGPSRLRNLVAKMYRFAFAKTPAVLFQNADDRDLFLRERLVRPGQGHLIPGSGVDLRRFVAAPLPRRHRFLMISRLLGDKGVREYVSAARTVKDKFPAATFALVGEIDSENRSAVHPDELRRWVAEGAVDYLGPQVDVRPYIRDASVVVLPSYREGLPRTLLEGAAMGRPLIGTDVPGCRELVREGVTGFLCEARNAQSLAAAMLKFVDMTIAEQIRMGAAARTMVEKEFDEKLVVAAYAELVDRFTARMQHRSRTRRQT